MVISRNDNDHISKDEARTPMEIFAKLDAEFHFDLDAAATPGNVLCPGFYTKEDNALDQPWYEDFGEDGCIKSIWCNPPYSAGNILKFVHKAYLESGIGATCVLLIPSDPSTQYFDFCFHNASEIRFLIPRVKFNRPSGIPMHGSPTTGSMIVVFRPGPLQPIRISIWKWKE